MTVHASDTFTGSNGSALSALWTAGYTGSGHSAAIQSNRARFTTGSASLIARRVSGVSQADGRVDFSYWVSGSSYFNFLVRHNTTTLDRNTCYSVRLPTPNDGKVGLAKVNGYSGTWSTVNMSVSAGNKYNVAISILGSELKVKVWLDGGAEPDWMVTLNDSSITAAGNWGFYVGGASSGAYVEVDDFVWQEAVVFDDLDDSGESLGISESEQQPALGLSDAGESFGIVDSEDSPPDVSNEVFGAAILVSGTPVTVGVAYTASMYVRPSLDNSLRMILQWRDSGGTVLSSVEGPEVDAPANQWARVYATGTAPASTVTLRVRAEAGPVNGVPFLTGQTLDGDGLLVTEGTVVWDLTSSPSQALTVERSINDVVLDHQAGDAFRLADPWFWVARPPGSSDLPEQPSPPPVDPPPDPGGGGGNPGTSHPTTVTIGSSTYPLSGQDPQATGGWGGDPNHTAMRGTDQLIYYSYLSGTTTATNQWGVEVTVGADGLVTAVNDRQVTQSLTGTAIPTQGNGYVLSGHGTARDWLLQYATVGASVQLTGGTTDPGGGGGGGGGGGTASAWRSTLPWALGVFGNWEGAAASGKVDDFSAMAGVALDFVDAHPDWEAIGGGDWWYAPHANRGYNICVSVPLYQGDINANNNSKWADAASDLIAAGWTKAWWRIGVEYNLNNSWRATDSNYTTWMAKYRDAVDSIRSVMPDAQFILCMNEGNPQSCSASTSDAIVNGLCGTGHVDMIGPDYYDQWEPIYNLSQATARFGTGSLHGTMNYWLARAKALGVKLAIPEWGVSSGSQWAGHTGNDNPFYINYVFDWAYANRDTVVALFYFEENASYLRSDLIDNTNPLAKAAFQAKVAQYDNYTSGTGGGGGGGGGTTPPPTGTWPLKLASNGYFLEYQNGTPFFYCADTGWVTLSRLTVSDAKRYIDYKYGQGFTVLQASLTAFNRSSGTYYRGLPFNGGDVSSPNLAYWAGIDELLAYLQSKGMAAWLVPLWGASNGSWDGGSSPSTSAMSTYCTWLGNRYKNQNNILWALGGDEQYNGDSETTARTGFWDAAAAALEATVPNHLKTFHPRWNNFNLSSAGWLDYNSIQHNNNQSPMTHRLAREGTEGYPKPFLNAEPPYNPGTPVGGIDTTRKRNRFNCWGQLLGGGLGVVYGGYRYGTYNIGLDGIFSWSDTDHPTAYDAGQTRKIMTQFHWERLVPNWDSSVITSSRGTYDTTGYIACGRASDGSVIAMYLPNGGSVTIALSQLSASGTARWYDPTTGLASGSAQSVSNSGTQTFSVPGNNSVGDNDWVLVLATSSGLV